MRRIRTAKKHLGNILHNDFYQLSRAHTLTAYGLKGVYTFIPKNACTTLRFSLAVHNGFIDDTSQFDWIRENNGVFVASQDMVATCDYSFVVLRCPYRRIASCYLDKIVGNVITISIAHGQKPDLSFTDFAEVCQLMPRKDHDIHWRAQSDFLLYEEYDDYFCVEAFADAVRTLDQRGFKVQDTRRIANHDTSSLNTVSGDFSRVPMSELARLKAKGEVPGYADLFNERARALVEEVYAEDIALYREKFGADGLLFQLT
jgi:hypothetical protein